MTTAAEPHFERRMTVLSEEESLFSFFCSELPSEVRPRVEAWNMPPLDTDLIKKQFSNSAPMAIRIAQEFPAVPVSSF